MLDARQHLIVLTTNAISPEALRRQPIGFQAETVHHDPFDLLTAEFPAEFLGRMDEIVLFNPLDPDAIRRIVQLRLREAKKALANRGILIELDDGRLVERINGAGEIARTGARGIARMIERLILQPVARALMKAPLTRPLKLRLEADGQVIRYTDPPRRIDDKASMAMQ